MRGYDNFNFPAFWRAAHALRAEGHQVTSPAELDILAGDVVVRDHQGAIFTQANPLCAGYKDEHLDDFKVFLTVAHSMAHFMRRDIPVICEQEAIVFLEGYGDSEGCVHEAYVADVVGCEMFEWKDGKLCLM